jgi:hypothetical protein
MAMLRVQVDTALSRPEFQFVTRSDPFRLGCEDRPSISVFSAGILALAHRLSFAGVWGDLHLLHEPTPIVLARVGMEKNGA